MGYVFLGLAIAFEVVGTSLLKSTNGLTRLWPTVICLAAYGVSFFMLAHTVKHLPVGVAYAIWSALGTAAIVAIGIVFFGEALGVGKMIGVSLVIAGVVVLNTIGGH